MFLYPNNSAKHYKWENKRESIPLSNSRYEKEGKKTGRQEYKNESKPQGMLLGKDRRRKGRVPSVKGIWKMLLKYLINKKTRSMDLKT